MFEGSCVALVTPMTALKEIDERAVADLVAWHLEAGTQAIVVAGTTGESPTVTPEEQLRLTRLVKAQVRTKIPVILATGTNSTASTITRSQAAQECGADGCLIVTPYYNRPTQAGLIAHFEAVAKATNRPIILYNVPSRTACDLLPETAAILSRIPNIIGIKEATGKLDRVAALKTGCEAGFLLLSGDDPSACDFMLQGGAGVISITSNIAPQAMQSMCVQALKQDAAAAQALDEPLQALHRMLVVEPNPIPVKWAMAQMGKIASAIRLPLTGLSSEHHTSMRQALQTAGIAC